MINQEEPLRHYLAGPIKADQKLTVLQLKISQIDETLRKDSLLNTIVNSFYDVLALYGQAFCLKNDDIFIVYSPKISDNTVRAALIKTWMHFSADKQTMQAEKLLERVYSLPEDKEALTYEISRIGNGPARVLSEKKEKKKFVAPPVFDKNQKLFTPEMLARVSKALQNTDFQI